MTGLEKIVAAIREEARAEAEAMIGQAEAEAARILADATAEGDALRAEAEASAIRQAADIERAAVSAVRLQRRRRLLEAKQEMLTDTMERALKQLRALPEDAYFSLLVKMASACAEPGEGELLLGERDLSRCPKDFAQRLAQALPSGAKLSISPEPRPIDGGFILQYGQIEQNCSFRAMLNARWEALTDMARGILFP